MSTFLVWLVVGIGIAGLAAYIWIREHDDAPSGVQDDVPPVSDTV